MVVPQNKAVATAALQEKIRRYCAYQERCPSDVRQKLYQWQIETKKAEKLLKDLVSDGYVNEERFAKAFVRGKFKIKSWGIAKITAELKKKSISGSCIAKALEIIDTEAYKETMSKLAKQWLSKHKTETEFVQKQKLFRYLASKGYKTDEVSDFINGKNSFV
ncbi:MAG: RecX family transcriptional regulator [Lentimicrobiaceae bacterium]|nr:RecX family transcriptional regulator [Lentimicrobiaceae bacterium]